MDAVLAAECNTDSTSSVLDGIYLEDEPCDVKAEVSQGGLCYRSLCFFCYQGQIWLVVMQS